MKKRFLRERLRARFFARVKDYREASILILGLGVHGGGVGAARFFARLGYKVIVTDLKAKKELSGSLKKLSGLDIRYILGRHRIKDITNSSLIVRNPGIPSDSPYLKAARNHKVPVTSDSELLLELAPREKIIGVTGTKGKTTTSMLIGHLLGKKACVLGIPGVSFFDYFYFRREPDWIVAEFSSFDLEYVKRSPHIAVFTSLFPDHLNRYPSFKKYASTKMNLIRYQTKGDIAILYSSPNLGPRRINPLAYYNHGSSDFYNLIVTGLYRLDQICQYAIYRRGDAE